MKITTKRYSICLLIASLFLTTGFAQVKVACVGNSITYGAAIENRTQDSYPKQLNELLGKGWTVKNFGVSGATMLQKGNKPYWDEDAFFDAIRFQPDVAIIMLGTNDSKAKNWQYNHQFKDNYSGMIEAFRCLQSDPHVYICLPLPVFQNRWGIQKTIVEGEIQQMIKEVAEEKDVPLIDMYTPFKEKPELTADNVHPNAEGAALIAKKIATVLKEKHALKNGQ